MYERSCQCLLYFTQNGQNYKALSGELFCIWMFLSVLALTLLLSERPKLLAILSFLRALGLTSIVFSETEEKKSDVQNGEKEGNTDKGDSSAGSVEKGNYRQAEEQWAKMVDTVEKMTTSS